MLSWGKKYDGVGRYGRVGGNEWVSRGCNWGAHVIKSVVMAIQVIFCWGDGERNGVEGNDLYNKNILYRYNHLGHVPICRT